jgi:hypothetical protein
MAKASKSERVVYAQKPLLFKILPEDLRQARCGDPSSCVVARGIVRTFPPRTAVAIHVGPGVTKIVAKGTVHVYRTPFTLSRALKEFDRTGIWPLRHGDYLLDAYGVPYGKKSKAEKDRINATKRKRHAALKKAAAQGDKVAAEKLKKLVAAAKKRAAERAKGATGTPGRRFGPRVSRRVISVGRLISSLD